MDLLLRPDTWFALVTLTALEIVLGIDNIIFLSVLTAQLPPGQQPAARRLGLLLAMITRLVLLFSLFWMTRLTAPLFSVFHHAFSLRDLVLVSGGLFLLAKSTLEIHARMEEARAPQESRGIAVSFAGVIAQIAVLDMVFSLDSVITAIGMARDVAVMAAAIVIAVMFMIKFVALVSRFIDAHPTLKVLALSFLVMVGIALVGDGFGMHVPRGYIYFAMCYSLMVEMLNIRAHRGAAMPPE